MQIEQKQNRVYKPQGVYTLSAEESNQITTELENLITEGGLTPNANVLTQVRDSVNNIVDSAANNLQTQIDAITSASDVFDVVGTYAQLQVYDTSTVPINDIIKVLQDETRQNAMTYYRWNGTAWVFIGAEGPYYTVAETDTKFALKTQLPGIATTAQAGLVKPDGQSIISAPDGTISAASTIIAALPLFTCQFSDHLIGNPSYLRADTFSWQSGSVYSSAYQHLVNDISGITSETETISGITITFYRATDGHKIVLADQESNVSAIYTATGVAWYYILDTANTRFKLPRTKYNVVGLRDTVGSYVPESLPNIKGSSQVNALNAAGTTGAFYTENKTIALYGSTQTNVAVQFDASRYCPTYQNNAPVQQRATQMYLYFYCGNTVQSQTTIDVGQITETLNGKADLDLSNVTNTGKSTAAGWAMPSSTASAVSLSTSSSNTMTSAGWVIVEAYSYQIGSVTLQIGNTRHAVCSSYTGGNAQSFNYYPVYAGETVNISTDGNGAVDLYVFVPCAGVN